MFKFHCYRTNFKYMIQWYGITDQAVKEINICLSMTRCDIKISISIFLKYLIIHLHVISLKPGHIGYHTLMPTLLLPNHLLELFLWDNLSKSHEQTMHYHFVTNPHWACKRPRICRSYSINHLTLWQELV